MMRRGRRGNRAALAVLILAAALAAAGSAFLIRAQHTASVAILTSEPIMFLYAEYFNSRQDAVRLSVEFTENPIEFRNRPGAAPDIIIQQNPAGPYHSEWFRAIDIELPDSTYPQLKRQFQEASNSRLLPLAFSLPMIVWHEQGAGSEAPLTLGLSQLAELNRVEPGDDHPTHIGFSPTWEQQLSLWTLRAHRARLWFSDSNTPAWEDEQIDATVTRLRDWISSEIGEITELEGFNDTYLYLPYYALLRHDRIDYHPSELRSFFALPVNLRRELDFAWYGSNGRIPILASMVYAAIPAQASQARAASDFLQWLSDPDRQQELMLYAARQELPEFGFFGGLSAQSRTNEQTIPELFPELQGMPPVASRLIFPEPLPWYWTELSRDVLEPFLYEAITSSEPLEAEVLQQRIQRWFDTMGNG